MGWSTFREGRVDPVRAWTTRDDPRPIAAAHDAVAQRLGSQASGSGSELLECGEHVVIEIDPRREELVELRHRRHAEDDALDAGEVTDPTEGELDGRWPSADAISARSRTAGAR